MSEPCLFGLPQFSWQLELSTGVIEKLRKHAQKTRFSRESVGQLFARDVTSTVVKVELATKLKPAWASWARVQVDINQATQERERLFQEGWHCVGLWHTHPEPRPEPSAEDRALAREHALIAKEYLDSLVFAILGNGKTIETLRVWVDDGHQLRLLQRHQP